MGAIDYSLGWFGQWGHIILETAQYENLKCQKLREPRAKRMEKPTKA